MHLISAHLLRITFEDSKIILRAIILPPRNVYALTLVLKLAPMVADC